MLSLRSGVVLGGCIALTCAMSLPGQNVISVRSGLIHYVEGRVLLDGSPVENHNSTFPSVGLNQELKTEEGRAEVLLTPGAFLRLRENSAVRMVSNSLTDTKVEVLSGSALVECTELANGAAITLQFHGTTVKIAKAGLYRVDTEPGRVRVFDGQALVDDETSHVVLTKGKEVLLDGTLAAHHFDTKNSDDLYNWSSRRSSYVARANVSSAQSAWYSGFADGCFANCWSYNPWFGMYTFLPGAGYAFSPFGGAFFSPYYANYAPYYYYGPTLTAPVGSTTRRISSLSANAGRAGSSVGNVAFSGRHATAGSSGGFGSSGGNFGNAGSTGGSFGRASSGGFSGGGRAGGGHR